METQKPQKSGFLRCRPDTIGEDSTSRRRKNCILVAGLCPDGQKLIMTVPEGAGKDQGLLFEGCKVPSSLDLLWELA